MSARSKNTNLQQLDSRRSLNSAENEQYLVNPVFLGAVHQTSKFDKQLEDDYEAAE